MAMMVKMMQEKVLQIGLGIFANGVPSCCQLRAAAYVPGILFAAIHTARMMQQKLPKPFSGRYASTTSAPIPSESKDSCHLGFFSNPDPRPIPRNSMSSLPHVMPQVVAANVSQRFVVFG